MRALLGVLLLVGCGDVKPKATADASVSPCAPGDRRCDENGALWLCAIKAAVCDAYDGGDCVIIRPQEDYAWRQISPPGRCRNN